MKPLHTRLTARLGLEAPILLAPMGTVAGGRLAAAVTNAGALGLIGGGYGDSEWLNREFLAAGNTRVGCGLITWSMARRPAVLAQVLERQPAVLMLSFGDPAPFAAPIKAAGSLLVCQVQSVAHAQAALDVGADIIVAQGDEAGGHSGTRTTFTLVPEVADLLARRAPETLLVAAGGVGDGRGLAAALMLGADGVMIGSAFLASEEAATPHGYQQAIVAADGDSTVKALTVDLVRGYHWPEEFVVRALRNRLVDTWHGREGELAREPNLSLAQERHIHAARAGDAENAGVLVGQAVGQIHAVRPAAAIVADLVATARAALERGGRLA